MQRQGFIFNPIQVGSPRSTLTRQHRDETNNGDFGPIGSAIRNQKFPSLRTKESEPLLLAQGPKTKQPEEQERREAKTGERLTTLHSQLYQQTEKLKQWKINTEIQMSDKDRKIADASKTIDSLRKSILELQFLNESVSSKLQDEKALKEEISQKIATTRNMCNALKEHLVRLENGVLMGESMLNVQKDDAKQREEQFQELALRFQELQIEVNSKELDMEKVIQKTHTEYNAEIEILSRKVKESEKRCQTLTEQYTTQDEQLKQTQDEVERIKVESSLHEEQARAAGTTVNEFQARLELEKKEQERIMQEYQQLESHHKVEVVNLENACKDRENEIRIQMNDLAAKEEEVKHHKSKINYLLEALDTKNLEIEDLNARMEELCKTKAEIESEAIALKSKSDSLQQTLNEMEIRLKNYKKANENMGASLEVEASSNVQLRQEISVLQESVKKAMEDEAEIKSLKEEIKAIEGNKGELQIQANFAMSQVEDITKQLGTLQNKNDTLEEEIKMKRQESDKYKEEHAEILKQLQDKELQLSQTITDLVTSKEETKQLQEKYEKLCFEKDGNDEALQEIMGSRDKTIATAESKMKTLQERVTAKVRQINKFQAEIKSLKAQLKVQEKSSKKLENELTMAHKNIEKLGQDKAAIAQEIREKESLITKDYEQLQAISSEKDKDRELLEREMEKHKKAAEMSYRECENARQDLATARQTFDAEIKEMCNTLENYKMENEKLMNAKEKELDEKTKDMIESKSRLEAALKERELELKTCNQQIANKDKKIEELIENLRYLKEDADKKRKLKDQTEVDVEMIDEEEKSSLIKEYEKRPDFNRILTTRRTFESPRVLKMFDTPKLATPSSIQQAVPETPQGILRYGDDRPGKSKRVAFQFNNGNEMSDEEDPLYKRQKIPNAVTPSRLPSKVISVKPTIRNSPKLVLSANLKAGKKEKGQTEEPCERSERKASKLEKREYDGENEEPSKFKMLFPNHAETKTKAKKDANASKKTPFKSKLKKVVPRSKKPSQGEKMDLSWFDADSAFGFGIEE